METEPKIIKCPECNGAGEKEVQWGYIPSLSYEENVEFQASHNDRDKSKIKRNYGAYWIIVCPLCEGEKVVYVAPAKIIVPEVNRRLTS